MGGKKKCIKPNQSNQMDVPDKKAEEEKRFVNLLHVYTIYKQKFRRINREEFEKILCIPCKGSNRAAAELCKELMKAKQIPDIVHFSKNVGFLSPPRLVPLLAMLAERSDYKLKPSLVKEVDFSSTPQRFKEKFAQLMVYGFWFLGRVISDSLSSNEQISRGNTFNFSKGDMGYWWAGVRILDWVCFLNKVKKVNILGCYSFVMQDPSRYRFYTDRAVINMHSHPLNFLSGADWNNYVSTVQTIAHKKIGKLKLEIVVDDQINEDSSEESYFSSCDSQSDMPSCLSSSELSINTLASRESID